MRQKKKEAISAIDDPLFYYETKITYQEKEAYNKRSRSEETGKAVKSCMNSYHRFLIEIKERTPEKICFADYTKDNLREYLFYLTDELKHANSTANQRISLIRSFLSYAADCNDSIMPIFLASKKIPKLSVPDTPIRYFSEEQIEAMLNAPDRTTRIGRRDSMILTLEYDLALRIHEIPLLRIRDLRLNGTEPHVMVSGKGGTYLPVPLSDAAVNILKQYLIEFHKNAAQDTPLFYGMYGTAKKSISVDTIESIISNTITLCQESGIIFPDKCSSHMIRKSRAMHLYERGISLPHIQQILRHKSMNTTSGFYAFATITTLKRELEEADKTRESGKNRIWVDPEIRKQINQLSK